MGGQRSSWRRFAHGLGNVTTFNIFCQVAELTPEILRSSPQRRRQRRQSPSPSPPPRQHTPIKGETPSKEHTPRKDTPKKIRVGILVVEISSPYREVVIDMKPSTVK